MPTYMGLRVTRYGPEVTSAVVGFIGTTLVRAPRKSNIAHPSSASQMATQMDAATTARVDGSPAIGKTSSRAPPPTNAAM